MILGLTGGISTGKSTVTAMLRQRGYTVIDADQIAREVVEPGMPAYQAIAEHFGGKVFKADGQLDRKKLAEIIFANQEERQALNEIIHPEIRRQMREQAKAAERAGESIVFMDIPLLYESKLTHMVDKVVVVYVNEDMQRARLMERDELDETQANRRLEAQLSIEEKRALADYLIDNQGSREETEKQVDELLRSLHAELQQ
ncbi:MAG: dephospho-CoA kinase [Clostridia bacterium]